MNRSTFDETSSKFSDLWIEISKGKRQPLADIKIDDDHIDWNGISSSFSPKDTYLNFYINEMWLTNERQFWKGVEPMVLTSTELLYLDPHQARADMQCVPLIIGPSILANMSGTELPDPKGITFLDTPVIGPVPYLGGKVVLTVIFYRVPTDNNSAQKLLKVVETISSVLPTVTSLSTFLALSRPLMTGLDLLLGTGKPLALTGKRVVFDDALSLLKPGYHVLINAPANEVDEQKLWIKHGRLYEGDSFDTATRFIRHDFVLFSLVPSQYRTDDASLDFYPLFRKAIDQASIDLELAAIYMQTLVQSLRASSELTRPDRKRLINAYVKEYSDTVLEHRAFLLEIEATSDWKHNQIEEALAKGKIGTSKNVDIVIESDQEKTWGELVLSGLDPRFP